MDSEAKWEFTRFVRWDGAPIQTVDDVCEVLSRSARCSERAELWGVTLPGPDGDVICHTGNGPNSEKHARLIAAAPDHALFASAVCAGAARWEPFPNNNGEVCVGGLRYAVKLDEFGCPTLNAPLRAALKATGAQT
jgi:hypothetical protein